jgi:hypothetical protein
MPRVEHMGLPGLVMGKRLLESLRKNWGAIFKDSEPYTVHWLAYSYRRAIALGFKHQYHRVHYAYSAEPGNNPDCVGFVRCLCRNRYEAVGFDERYISINIDASMYLKHLATAKHLVESKYKSRLLTRIRNGLNHADYNAPIG